MNKKVEIIASILALPKVGTARAWILISDILAEKISLEHISSQEIFERAQIRWPNIMTKTSFSHYEKERGALIGCYLKGNQSGIEQVSFLDSNYPTSLRLVKNPPLLLHYKGDLNALQDFPSLALIGTRKPLRYTEVVGKKIAAQLVEKGIHLVSGLAEGCDAIAHRAAVNAGKATTAIVGHGLHTIFPRVHKDLSQSILEAGGLLLSEFQWGVEPHKGLFVRRDYLQARVSHATFVLETSLSGGSLHAMDETIKINRPLFALSYPDQSPLLTESGVMSKIAGNKKYITDNQAIPILNRENLTKCIETVRSSYQNISQIDTACSAPNDQDIVREQIENNLAENSIQQSLF